MASIMKPFAEKLKKKQIAEVGLTYCEYCGCTVKDGHTPKFGVRFPDNLLTIDHIIPRSKGGQNVLDNMRISCYRCNTRKGDTILKEIQ